MIMNICKKSFIIALYYLLDNTTMVTNIIWAYRFLSEYEGPDKLKAGAIYGLIGLIVLVIYACLNYKNKK